MKKLLTVGVIVSLVILSTAFALAGSHATPPSPFPATFDVGALYATNSSGTVTTDNGTGNTTPSTPGDATVTVNQAKTTPPEPYLFYGTFQTAIGATTGYNTFDFTAAFIATFGTYAFGAGGQLFLTGTDANGDLLQATATFQKPSPPWWNTKGQRSLSLQGVIIIAPGSTKAETYSFGGTLAE